MALVGVVLAIAVAIGGGEGWALGNRVAVVEVDGLIADDEELLEDIRRFRRDPSVKALVVAINSPGGAVAPSQSIFQELKDLRADEGVPVIATIGSVGASGGYLVALAADSIFALPGSITGSIGVILEFPEVSDLMEKVGVRMQVVKSSEHKDIGSPFRPITPEDREILEDLVLDVYEQFVEVVAAERDLSTEEVRRLADGRVLSGRQALAGGLVDRLGNVSEAIATAGRMAGLGDEPRVVRPPEDRFTLWDVLLGRGAGRSAAALMEGLGRYLGPRLSYVPL